MENSKFAAFGLSIVLAAGAGGCQTSKHETGPPGPIFTAEDKAFLKKTFDADKALLLQRKVGGVAGLHLILVEGSDVFDKCRPPVLTAIGPGPEYCEGAVVINSGYVYETLPRAAAAISPDPEKQKAIIAAGEEYAVGHEAGHGAQQKDPTYEAETKAQRVLIDEPQADCYAGVLMKATAPQADLSLAVEIIEHNMSVDAAHGGHDLRRAAFLQGAGGGSCDAATISTLRLEFPEILPQSPPDDQLVPAPGVQSLYASAPDYAAFGIGSHAYVYS